MIWEQNRRQHLNVKLFQKVVGLYLFLVSSELISGSKLSYDHSFRTQEGMSDHSALMLELRI